MSLIDPYEKAQNFIAITKKSQAEKDLQDSGHLYQSINKKLKDNEADGCKELNKLEISHLSALIKQSTETLGTLIELIPLQNYCGFARLNNLEISKYCAAEDYYCDGIAALIHNNVAPGLYATKSDPSDEQVTLRYNLKLMYPTSFEKNKSP